MKLLEIKNNLVKMTYQSEESVALGRFIALEDNSKSYIGQVVNLKADIKANYAIVKLLFTVTEDGIIDNYDGSIPSLQAKIFDVNSSEITNLIPVEKPIYFGYLAQQETKLNIDQTFFETNPIICAEKYDNINTLIHNFTSQLINGKEKVVVLDIDHNYTEENSFRFKRDFKLPLDGKRLNHIINFELEDIDTPTKAVIQDILLEINEYINSLPDGFLPFDTLLGVISSQYETTKIPELAILKNKLIQYQNSFAQNKEEIYALKAEVQTNKLTYIDIDDDSEEMQRELIEYIHEILQDVESYVYMFVKLTNKNSNKKLLKDLIESDKVFTTIICSHNHKYIQELKQRAQGIILFAPQTTQHDFAAYNTFLSKLGSSEFIVYGRLTQEIPFIVELSDISEDITYENTEEAKKTTADSDINTEDKSIEINSEDNFEFVEDDIEGQDGAIEEGDDVSIEQKPILIEEVNETEDQSLTDNIEDGNTYKDNLAETESTNTEAYPKENEKETFTSPIENDSEEDLNLDDNIFLEIGESEISDHDKLVEKVADDVDEIYYNKAEDIPSVDELTDNGDETLTENDLDFIDGISPVNEDNDFQNLSDINDNPEYINESTTEAPDKTEVEATDESVEEEIFTEDTKFENIPTDYEVEEELPVYPTEEAIETNSPGFEQGDSVTHPKYGKGIIEKLIKYGNKTLCSISFENVGRRLLDPAMSELQRV